MIPLSVLSVENSRYGIRETTEGVKRIIPELGLVGHVNYHTARPSYFFHHKHAKVLEIFYIVRGKVSWWVEGSSTEVWGNELFLIWPEEWHGTRDNIVEPAEYYWIQVELPGLRSGRTGNEVRTLTQELRRNSQRKLTGTHSMLPLYQSLLQEHAREEPCRASVVRETLHLLLSLILRCSQTDRPSRGVEKHYRGQISQAIEWTKAHVPHAKVSDMIRESRLDVTTFRKQFLASMGLSASQYLIRLRLQNAKERLVQGSPITEVAHEFGFSSSQYFATVFLKYEGLSPSAFLERIQKSR